MKQEKVNVRVIRDNRRQKDGLRFPLKLRLTYKGLRRYYGTGYDVSKGIATRKKPRVLIFHRIMGKTL